MLLMSFFFFLCISLSSCEKDLYEQSIKNENRKIKITTVNLKDLSKSKDLYSNFISTKNKLNTDNFKSRLTYNTDFGFYIDTDNMKMIESDNFKTLTAQIYRIGKLDKKENLYIHQNNDGSYYAYIFDYTFNEEDINKYVLNQPIYDIIVKTKFKPLDYTVNATSNATSGYNGTVIPYNGYCYTINHVYEGEDGEPWVTLVLCPNCECNSTPNTETLTQDGGSGGGLINIIYIPGSGVGPTGGGVPTSGSNNTTGNSYSNPVLTQPVISQNMTEIKILSLLNEEQTNWWWFTATKVIKDEMITFFNSSGFTDENNDFSKQMINQMMQNPGLVINLDASSKSPGNIDLSRVTPDPNNPDELNKQLKIKFLCVYNKLIKSPEFKRLFLDMFGENTRPNLIFEIADLPGDANGGRVGETTILTNNPLNNTIKIDSNLLENGNTMNILQVILHECIHSFLNIKLADPNIGITIPALNNMEVSQCINEYYNGFNAPQNQHDFIFTYMMNTMQTIFSEVKNLLISPEENVEIENLTLHINQNTTPITNVSTPWNWNDFYENLSLNGLQNCSAFASEIATVVNGASTNVVNEMKWSKFIQYRTVAFTNLPTSCH